MFVLAVTKEGPRLILLCYTKTAPLKKQFNTYLICNQNITVINENVKKTIEKLKQEKIHSGLSVTHPLTQTPLCINDILEAVGTNIKELRFPNKILIN